VPVTIREQVTRSGWRLAFSAVHFSFAPQSCRLDIFTLTVKPFSLTARFATLPTWLFNHLFRSPCRQSCVSWLQ
jgi:hypothetical protein